MPASLVILNIAVATVFVYKRQLKCEDFPIKEYTAPCILTLALDAGK